ncbi:MAG: GtrA family protein [Clostridia bacterium]|nr:GtrA family protein [Clostridia bacterium]
MINRIKELMAKHRSVLVYLVIGVLTTAVDTVVYYVPGVSSIDIVEIRNTIAWAAAVLFAFWGNRTFVFTENTKGKRVTAREFYEFVLSRVFSLIVSNVVIAVLTKGIGMSADWAKIPTSVIVVVLNYITGKLVFRKKK